MYFGLRNVFSTVLRLNRARIGGVLTIIKKSAGLPAPLCRIRSADFQSAVSQVCNLRAIRPSTRTDASGQALRSELPQIENLRYSRLQTCATPKAFTCSLSARPGSDCSGAESVGRLTAKLALPILAMMVLLLGHRSEAEVPTSEPLGGLPLFFEQRLGDTDTGPQYLARGLNYQCL